MRKKSLLLFMFLFGCVSSRADVNLYNGNFYTSFSDIFNLKSAIGLKLERVYNSKSNYVSIFSYSWGSNFEYIGNPNAYGGITLTAYGGGADFIYKLVSDNGNLQSEIINEVCDTKLKNQLLDAATLSEYKVKLTNDFDFLNTEYLKLLSKKLLRPKQLIPGSTLVSDYGEKIIILSSGYKHTLLTGGYELYNDNGKIVKLVDKNDNFIDYTYSKDSLLIKVVDNDKNCLDIYYNDSKYVDSIDVNHGEKNAVFKYEKTNNVLMMSYCRDVNGVANTFKYTKDKYVNLAQIGDADGKTMDVEYHGSDKHVSTKAVKNPNGTYDKYDYNWTKMDSINRYTVTSDFYTIDSVLSNHDEYIYDRKNLSDGSVALVHTRFTQNNIITETFYNNAYPALVITNGDSIQYKYNWKWNMNYKEDKNSIIKIDYEPKCSKVKNCVIKNKINNTEKAYTFKYDLFCNIIEATDNNMRKYSLCYDSEGHITKIINDAKELRLEYNKSDKPIKITLAENSIVFSYNSRSAVEKIDGDTELKNTIFQILNSLDELCEDANFSVCDQKSPLLGIEFNKLNK